MLVRIIVLAGCLLAGVNAAVGDDVMVVPAVVGPWWQVAGDPDLGPWTTTEQQPVDFAVWQAADGTWQLWSCIRKTNCGGQTRLFHAWEGRTLTDKNWKPLGIAMTADAKYGETVGGLQAPHVITRDGIYHMLYGDWHHICAAQSNDGKRFERSLDAAGRAQLFSEDANDFGNTRDPMLLKVGRTYHCYYTAFPDHKGAVYCRTSEDLRHWSPSKIVSRGGSSGDNPTSAECPHVVYHQASGYFYLFRTQRYGQNAQTNVYRSKDPMDFGVDDDRCLVSRLPIAAPELVLYQGEWYIAALLPSLKGIQIARLDWHADPDWVRPGAIRGKSVFDFGDPKQRALWRRVEGNIQPLFTTSTRSNFAAPSRYFIGTAESARGPGRPDDAQTGLIESPPFQVSADRYFALVSGGNNREATYVALVESETGKELVRLTGSGNSNRLEPATIDLRAYQGKKIFVRVVDRTTGSWGHINFGGLFADADQ